MTGYYGGEVCLVNLAAGLRRRGHAVTCAVRPGSRLEAELRARGIAVTGLPLRHWFDPMGVGRLRRWLVREGVEILHTHLPRDYFLAAVASAGTGVRNVGSRHQLHPVSQAVFKRPFLRRFAAMIAVSAAVRRGLLESGLVEPGRVATVPNGIELPGPAGSPASLRSRAGLGPAAPVVGFVGRLCPGKGIETLLQAASLLGPRYADLHVFVLGDAPGRGRYLEHLRAVAARHGIAARVHFFGYVPDAALACAEFDVQVLCSRAEPFGLVTLEAMAQRRPVVVTDTGGSPEIVRDGIDGFLVPPGDAAALAVRLACLLESPGLRAEMGRRGRLRVERWFTTDRMVRATEGVYAAALGAGERRARMATA